MTLAINLYKGFSIIYSSAGLSDQIWVFFNHTLQGSTFFFYFFSEASVSDIYLPKLAPLHIVQFISSYQITTKIQVSLKVLTTLLSNYKLYSRSVAQIFWPHPTERLFPGSQKFWPGFHLINIFNLQHFLKSTQFVGRMCSFQKGCEKSETGHSLIFPSISENIVWIKLLD